MLGQLNGLSKHFFGNDIPGQLFGTDPGLGTDPAGDGFGSVRFRAEVPGSDGVNPTTTRTTTISEAKLCTAWPTSPLGMVTLESDGLTAQHRYQPGKINIPGLGPVGPGIPGVVIDPEWSRPPGTITDNHVFDDQHHH